MATIIKSKARVFGDCINTKELLEALKNPFFHSENSPIQISTEFYSDFLKMIYICPNCMRLHLCCGELTAEAYCEKIINLDVHYQHYTDQSYITREELISVLESLPAVLKIALENTQEEKAYSLTEVFKCSDECEAVHLDCTYENNSIRLN